MMLVIKNIIINSMLIFSRLIYYFNEINLERLIGFVIVLIYINIISLLLNYLLNGIKNDIRRNIYVLLIFLSIHYIVLINIAIFNLTAILILQTLIIIIINKIKIN
jgi:hypothetical protein